MNDNIETPTWLMNHFKHHFDPCPINPKFDGLKIRWKNPSFVNPPFSNIKNWVIKAIHESNNGINVVLLLRCDPSTKSYKLLIETASHIAYFNERIQFKNCKNTSNFSSMLVFLEGKKN